MTTRDAPPVRPARPVRDLPRARAALACALLATLAPFAASLPAATLEVSFEGMPNDAGQALFALFAGSEGFPDRVESAVARRRADVVEGRARVRFEDVAAGDYALSALHDANGSGAIDLNLFGVPTEKFGVSNVVRGRPEWHEALFSVEAGAEVIVIELRPLRFF